MTPSPNKLAIPKGKKPRRMTQVAPGAVLWDDWIEAAEDLYDGDHLVPKAARTGDEARDIAHSRLDREHKTRLAGDTAPAVIEAWFRAEYHYINTLTTSACYHYDPQVPHVTVEVDAEGLTHVKKTFAKANPLDGIDLGDCEML